MTIRLKPCSVHGCGELTPFSRCAEHARKRAAAIADDRHRREPWRYLYGLTIWRDAREAARRQSGYRCEECGLAEELAGERALDVHHNIALEELWRRAGGGTPQFDQSTFERAATLQIRLIVLCDPCHARLDAERRAERSDRLAWKRI